MIIPPILLLIFNRPETTALVMEAIRAALPPRLYVAADGPRDGKPGEAERCAEVRRIATDIDWPCDVRTLFRERNLGCRQAVSGAITWFFEKEPEGIILEDDCLPSQSFFPYAAELLDRYRDDERVMCITGNNFQKDMSDFPYSYYFSRYNHCWGWASWRRAWRLYDADMEGYPDFVSSDALSGMSSLDGFSEYWSGRFNEVALREIDSWAYVWTYSCWANNGLTCTPTVNLVSNIGFGVHGTRTTDAQAPFANMPAAVLQMPLHHPLIMVPDNRFDDYASRFVFGIEQVRPQREGAAAAAIKASLRRLRSLARELLPSRLGR